MATSASNWKSARQGEEVPLPSGNTALIRRPGMESLFAAGVLPDELTKIAIEQIEMGQKGPQDHKPKQTAEGLDPEVMKKFLSGENAIADIFDSFDRITAMCVVEPTCLYHKRRVVDPQTGVQNVDDKGRPLMEEIPQSDREEDVIYTDDVDVDDKTFIFNFVVGGTRDIETFRQESGLHVATVSRREDVELPPVGPDGAHE